MVYNSSEYEFSNIVSNILDEPLGYILFSDDFDNSLLLKLESETKYDERQVLADDKNKVCVYIVPVRYSANQKGDMNHRVDCRNFVIDLIYEKWCESTGKPQKSPYTSKTFMTYLEDVGFLCCDFIVISTKSEQTVCSE